MYETLRQERMARSSKFARKLHPNNDMEITPKVERAATHYLNFMGQYTSPQGNAGSEEEALNGVNGALDTGKTPDDIAGMEGW